MSEEERVFSEQPEEDQWRFLLQYSYDHNVQAFLQATQPAPSQETIDAITGSVLQANDYFRASKASSLQISPLLLYYGSTHLYFALALLVGLNPNIKSHGMEIEVPGQGHPLGTSIVKPVGSQGSGLLAFLGAFSRNAGARIAGEFQLSDLLGTVPELLDLSTGTYKSMKPHVLPLELVRDETGELERIPLQAMERYVSADEALVLAPIIKKAYLQPQLMANHIVLRRRRSFTDPAVHSISGRRFLLLSHECAGSIFEVPPPIAVLMALFALGMLCRYHPATWAPFVLRDQTGERHVIEWFVSYARRIVPNLVLNRLLGRRIVFVGDKG